MNKRILKWNEKGYLKSGMTFLAIIVAMLFSVATVFAQGRGNGYGKRQGERVHEHKAVCKKDLKSATNVAVTRIWVEAYPYSGYRFHRNRNEIGVAIRHPKGLKVAGIHGKKYFVKKGKYVTKRGHRFVETKPARVYRNF